MEAPTVPAKEEEIGQCAQLARELAQRLERAAQREMDALELVADGVLLGRFLATHCTLGAKHELYVPESELLRAFGAYCDRQGRRPDLSLSLSPSAIRFALVRCGAPVRRAELPWPRGSAAPPVDDDFVFGLDFLPIPAPDPIPPSAACSSDLSSSSSVSPSEASALGPFAPSRPARTDQPAALPQGGKAPRLRTAREQRRVRFDVEDEDDTETNDTSQREESQERPGQTGGGGSVKRERKPTAVTREMVARDVVLAPPADSDEEGADEAALVSGFVRCFADAHLPADAPDNNWWSLVQVAHYCELDYATLRKRTSALRNQLDIVRALAVPAPDSRFSLFANAVALRALLADSPHTRSLCDQLLRVATRSRTPTNLSS